MLTAKNDNQIYLEVFDRVLLVMPNNSRRSINDDPFSDLPSEQLFEEFSHEVVEKVESIRDEFTEIEQKEKDKNAKKGIKKKVRTRNQLLVLDDITATLKDKSVMRSLIELATNRRHHRLSIILLVQFTKSIPRPVRFQLTSVCLFKPANNGELKILEEEFISLRKDDFEEICRFVFQNPHDFLFLDKDHERYFKNLSEIVLPKKFNEIST
jgi:hypothetical protein